MNQRRLVLLSRFRWKWSTRTKVADALFAYLAVAVSVASGADWPAYGADSANSKYSALAQIHRENVERLRVAWRWRSPDAEIIAKRPDLRPWLFEATPVALNGILYTSTSMSQVAALDGRTGKSLWVYDPKSYEARVPPVYGFAHRGVAVWREGSHTRVLMTTGDARLIALDGASGKPVMTFGDNGTVDLTQHLNGSVDKARYGMSSPPIVCRCRDVIVVGSVVNEQRGHKIAAPGDIRGYDVRTGKLLWTFHSIPLRGEFGAQTWEQDSNRNRRGVHVWSLLSADEQLGYVYLPFSTAPNDYYGGERPGDNLFAESLVCLNVKDGKRVWHYQFVHHGLWDYDLPAAPILVDIAQKGKRIAAVAQLTKQAFCFVFDRRTGQPLWPIEERPVARTTVPGEKSAATQPFPSRPKPFDRQGVSADDLIDFTPELRRKALEILGRFDYGELFAPPSLRGTVYLPGIQGGASWAGAAFDPDTGRLFVPSVTRPAAVTLQAMSDPSRDRYASGQLLNPLEGPDGLPLFKPPFGRITAIDLSSGDHAWMAPSGIGPIDHPALLRRKLPRLGWPLRTFVLATKTLLFAAQEGPVANRRLVDDRYTLGDHSIRDAKLRAYSKTDGSLIAEIELPANASGSPMTYMAGNKQFLVTAVGGSNLPAELVALALP